MKQKQRYCLRKTDQPRGWREVQSQYDWLDSRGPSRAAGLYSDGAADMLRWIFQLTESSPSQKIIRMNQAVEFEQQLVALLRKEVREDEHVKGVLLRLMEKVERANAVQHSGGKVLPEDWSELYQLTNEARAFLNLEPV